MKKDNLYRIMIIGNACAGKTTLAKELHRLTEIPVYHLDAIVWQEGFLPTPPKVRIKAIREIIERPKWIIEGVSFEAARKADAVIFLDVSRSKLIFRAVNRSIKSIISQRPELPSNCKDWKVFFLLIKIIWNFPSQVRPEILNIIESPTQVLHYQENMDPKSVLADLKLL